MGAQRTKGRTVHPGWLQPDLLSSLVAREQQRVAQVNPYLPADDPRLSMLIERLQGDFPRASEVAFFAGNTSWPGDEALTALLHEHGWLVVARHRLQSGSVATEHLVVTGWMACGAIPPDVCQRLTACSFDRIGSIEVPEAIVADLMEQARQFSTDANRKLHRQRIKAEAPPRPPEPLSIQDLDRGLDAIERRAARMRKRIAAIPFKTDEYHALDRELDGIVQEFHATLKQRRAVRLKRGKGSPRPATRADSAASEALDPVVIVRWKLAP